MCERRPMPKYLTVHMPDQPSYFPKYLWLCTVLLGPCCEEVRSEHTVAGNLQRLFTIRSGSLKFIMSEITILNLILNSPLDLKVKPELTFKPLSHLYNTVFSYFTA